MSSHQAESPRAHRKRVALKLALWALPCCLLLLLALWPIFAPMASVNDDINYSRMVHARASLGESLRGLWYHRFYRPIDIIGGYLVDPETLDARGTLLLQVPAWIAIFGAVWVALRRLTPEWRIAFPIAVAWLVMHTSTATACWQHDTISQIWAAACGLWMGIILWDAIARAGRGLTYRWHIMGLLPLTLLGVLSKEIFYGWVASAGLLLLIITVEAAGRLDRRTLLAALSLMAAVAVVPAAYFLIRWTYGGLGNLGHQDTAQYQLHLGFNVIVNFALGLGGYFAAVPVHVARDPLAAPLLRMLPVLGLILTVLVVVLPWVLSWRTGRRWPGQPDGRMVAAVGLFTFLGFSATLPTRQISELYLMGPNAGAAVLVAISVVGLGRWCSAAMPAGRWIARLGRPAFATAIALIALVGSYGLVSRAVHARVTWLSVTRLNRTLLAYQESLPAGADREARVFLWEDEPQTYQHCQYIISPIHAMNLYAAQTWLDHRDPTRHVRLIDGAPTEALHTGDLAVNCAGLPRRPHW